MSIVSTKLPSCKSNVKLNREIVSTISYMANTPNLWYWTGLGQGQKSFFSADPGNPLKEVTTDAKTVLTFWESFTVRMSVTSCSIKNDCLSAAPSPKNVLYKISSIKSLSYFKEDV